MPLQSDNLPFICPKCNSSLAAWREQPTGIFSCPGCKESYTLVDGIYHFVEDDVYLENFSFEWERHARLYFTPDGQRGTERTLAKLHLTPETVRGKRVLDVGCGTGRFSEIFTRWGAAQVVAVDLSEAIHTAQKNLSDRPGILFVQADLTKLPFPTACFDIILAWGVLHHTPNTENAFKVLARHLRPGGTMAVYIYGKSKGMRRRFMALYRKVTPHLPHRVLHWFCKLSVPMYYVYKIPLLGNLFRVLLPMSRQKDARERVLETFDEYSPRYAWRHTFPEVQQWFVDAGMHHNRLFDPPIYAVGWLPETAVTTGDKPENKI